LTPDFFDWTLTNPEGHVYECNLFGKYFHYLEAERIGPRTYFTLSDSHVSKNLQLGKRGEYAAHFLEMFGRQNIPNTELYHKDESSTKLLDQVSAWMGEVSPGAQIELALHPSMDLVNLQYSFKAGRYLTNAYRTTNVGFGLTYTLPILIAVLSAPSGGLVIVENPEAHLHPKGQFRLGEFFSLAAGAGIQIVIETHSDHILNGVRVAVHNRKLDAEKVRLHFFEQREDDDKTFSEVVSPTIDEKGRIDYWPDDFFDQWEKSLAELVLADEG
jgi:predicted ATPase